MSRKGNCWDNSVAESFFSSLKFESIHLSGTLTSIKEARSLGEYSFNGAAFMVYLRACRRNTESSSGHEDYFYTHYHAFRLLVMEGTPYKEMV